MGLDGGVEVFFIGRDGDDVEAWGKDDGAVARTAVGGEVEGFRIGIVGGARSEAACGVVEGVDGGGGDGAELLELRLGEKRRDE